MGCFMRTKYEFETDGRDVYFAGTKVPSYIGGKHLTCENLCNTSVFKVDCTSSHPREVYKAFNEKWGITPTKFIKKFRGVWWACNVEPVREWVGRYSIGANKKINLANLDKIWNMKSEIEQAHNDGLDNLIPFIIYNQLPIQDAKKAFGKSVWKQLCKNSTTRNKYIAMMLSNNFRKGDVQYVVQLPSTVLKRGRMLVSNPLVAYVACKHFKCKDVIKPKQDVVRFGHTVTDTIRMAKRLGREVNLDWSVRKWKEKHEEFTRKILEEQYSDKTFPCLEEVPEELKSISYGGVSASLLDNALSLKQESNVMRHCVGSYVDNVASGDYLVYHLKMGDEHHTTLGLHKYHDQWRVHQHYGVCNSKQSVTEGHVDMSHKICEMLNGGVCVQLTPIVKRV